MDQFAVAIPTVRYELPPCSVRGGHVAFCPAYSVVLQLEALLTHSYALLFVALMPPTIVDQKCGLFHETAIRMLRIGRVPR